MAQKTRTPRQSSGTSKARKEARSVEQEIRKDQNLAALAEIPGGTRFLAKTSSNGETLPVRPSKALRKAQRAQRFAARSQG